MCGIAGLVQLEPGTAAAAGAPDAVATVEHMVANLRHRGPDDCGLEAFAVTRESSVVLGHTRLAIIDLSPGGHQPMLDGAGTLALSYNGEIYNFQEVRSKLAPPPGGWRSQSDTEVLLQAYSQWGTGCLEHLRGMFALAIWDGRRRELFLARDRFGIKPLYTYRGPGVFLFASEVDALLDTGLVPRRLDTLGLWQYLGYQSVPAPRTMVEGVAALPPGCWMTVDAAGRVTQRRYWDLLQDRAPDGQGVSEAEARRRTGELLHESAALHLVSDVPVGAFLSGGIDSSAVVGLMREAGTTPRTFSIGFAEREFDETRFARQIAGQFGAQHTEILLKEADLLDQLPAALDAMDQPTGDGINTYVVSGAVRATGITVALSGLGGDELFAGYPSFARLEKASRLLHSWGRVPPLLRSAAGGIVGALGQPSVRQQKASAMLRSDGSLATLFPLTRQLLSDDQRQALLRPGLSPAGCGAVDTGGPLDPYPGLLADAFRQANGSIGPLAQVAYAEARTYMHDVLLRDTDQMSMAHALEVRVPLLDHKLAEYVMGLPDAVKRANGTPKRLLVSSLNGLLPPEIVQRRKRGFTLPFEPWMRGPLRGFCEARVGPGRLGERGLFEPAALASLWSRFVAGDGAVPWNRVWVLVALDEWLERTGMQVPG